MITYLELLQKGGSWLGAVRNWIQCKKINGERVTWGSNDVLHPEMTVKEIEEIAAISAASILNEIKEVYIIGKKYEDGKIDISFISINREAARKIMPFLRTKGLEVDIIPFSIESTY